jgi:Putative metallopeptidase domain/VWA-like domain (DUF2201)
VDNLPVFEGLPTPALEHGPANIIPLPAPVAFEEIYAALISKPPAPDGGNPPPPSPDGRAEAPGNGPPDSSSPGEFCQGAVDEAEVKEQESKWRVALKQAATMAKSQGRLPASMDRLINKLLDPQTPWREVLRTMLTSVCKDDYSWSQPNRRYSARHGGHAQALLPSLHSPRLGRIVVAIDTSGSIGQKELDEFLAEIRGIIFDCRPEKLVIVQCGVSVLRSTSMQADHKRHSVLL